MDCDPLHRRNTRGKLHNCPSFPPGGKLQTIAQEGEAQAQHSYVAVFLKYGSSFLVFEPFCSRAEKEHWKYV